MDHLLELLEDTVPNIDFKNEKHLVSGEILDSLGIVNIFVMIQDEYDFEIEFDELDPKQFESLESIWALVSRYINK